MEWIYIACFAVIMIVLMMTVYLLTQHDYIITILNRMLERLNEEAPEPQGVMDLMLLKADKRKKTRRFTDRSRDWLTAHEKESRR